MDFPDFYPILKVFSLIFISIIMSQFECSDDQGRIHVHVHPCSSDTVTNSSSTFKVQWRNHKQNAELNIILCGFFINGS